MSPDKNSAVRAVKESERAVREAGTRSAEINQTRDRFLNAIERGLKDGALSRSTEVASS